jgi:hypothetical protein
LNLNSVFIFLFEVIDYPLQDGMGMWVVAVVYQRSFAWGLQVSPCQAAAAAAVGLPSV